MANLLVENIGRLVTMDDSDTTLTNAALWIQDGRVSWIGTHSEAPSPPADVVWSRLDAHGCVVTPGLVDCHTHTVFGGDRRAEFALRSEGASYETIAASGGGIRNTMQATRAASVESLFAEAVGRLDEMLARGVTTIEIKSGYGLELETELKMLGVIDLLSQRHPCRIEATFLGAHTVPPEFTSTFSYAEHVVQDMLPAVAEQGVARFCDVFCERGTFDEPTSRRILEAAQGFGLIPKVHAEQLSRQGGAALGVALGAASVDHLEYLNEADVRALAESDTVAVLLPGAAVTLNVQTYPPARALLDAGVAVALATDCNPGSSMCVDLPLMTTFASTLMGMTPSEAWRGVTRSAADALRRPDLGRLELNGPADLVVWDADHEDVVPYRFGAVRPRAVVIAGAIEWYPPSAQARRTTL